MFRRMRVGGQEEAVEEEDSNDDDYVGEGSEHTAATESRSVLFMFP
jgi:hypothetical protein